MNSFRVNRASHLSFLVKRCPCHPHLPPSKELACTFQFSSFNSMAIIYTLSVSSLVTYKVRLCCMANAWPFLIISDIVNRTTFHSKWNESGLCLHLPLPPWERLANIQICRGVWIREGKAYENVQLNVLRLS